MQNRAVDQQRSDHHEQQPQSLMAPLIVPGQQRVEQSERIQG